MPQIGTIAYHPPVDPEEDVGRNPFIWPLLGGVTCLLGHSLVLGPSAEGEIARLRDDSERGNSATSVTSNR